MLIAMVVLLTGATPQASPPARGSAAQRADHARGQASQARFEQTLFEEAGFTPLSRAVAEKRVLKRALFQDPYGMLAIPGVEVERMADGSVTLTLIGRAGRGMPAVLPADAWGRLTGLQGVLLTPRPYVP